MGVGLVGVRVLWLGVGLLGSELGLGLGLGLRLGLGLGAGAGSRVGSRVAAAAEQGGGRACRYARPCERCDMKWAAAGSSSACGAGRLWMYRARSVSHSCTGTEAGGGEREGVGVITR